MIFHLSAAEYQKWRAANANNRELFAPPNLERGRHETLRRLPPDQNPCWAFSPDGKQLAIGGGKSDEPYGAGQFKFSRGSLRVFDAQTGEILVAMPPLQTDNFDVNGLNSKLNLPRMTFLHCSTGAMLDVARRRGTGEITALHFDEHGLQVSARELSIDGK